MSLNSTVTDFVAETLAQATDIFAAFRDTGTIKGWGTVGFVQRIPGEDKLVTVNDPGPLAKGKPVTASVTGLDGTSYTGEKFSALRYAKVFNAHPTVTTLSHVHSPALGAWAQTHRTLPFTYVPVQRFNLARELPVYIDRRVSEDDFIVSLLNDSPRTPGILEANGGATVWGWKGLLDLAEFIILLEEGADIIIRATALGGSRTYGPGVLRQQWKMSKLFDTALAEGLLPATDTY